MNYFSKILIYLLLLWKHKIIFIVSKKNLYPKHNKSIGENIYKFLIMTEKYICFSEVENLKYCVYMRINPKFYYIEKKK